MRMVAVAVVALVLAGCAGQLQSPPQPTPTSVEAAIRDISTITTDPVTAWQASEYAVRAACDAYLNEAAARAAGLNIASQGVGLGGAAAAGFLTISGNLPGAIIAPAMASLIQSFLSSLQSSGAMPYTTATSNLIDQAMLAYEDAVSPPMTLAQAMVDTEGFWFLCTPAGYQELVTKAMASAAVTASPGPTSPAALFQNAPPLAFRETPASASPPRVMINGH